MQVKQFRNRDFGFEIPSVSPRAQPCAGLFDIAQMGRLRFTGHPVAANLAIGVKE
jgi:hypothetical protein